jgi:hypothetical protein
LYLSFFLLLPQWSDTTAAPSPQICEQHIHFPFHRCQQIAHADQSKEEEEFSIIQDSDWWTKQADA